MKELPHDSSNPKVVAALRQKPPGVLLALYFNWRERLVPDQPRRAMRSVEFDSNPVVTGQPEIIEEIIRDIEQGSDLTKYMSERVKVGFELPRNSSKKNRES